MTKNQHFKNCSKRINLPNYNLCHITCFKIPLVNSVYNGIERITFLGPKVWELIPEEVKQKESLNAFKDAIKKWSPTNCPCRLCKYILHGVGFLQ